MEVSPYQKILLPQVGQYNGLALGHTLEVLIFNGTGMAKIEGLQDTKKHPTFSEIGCFSKDVRHLFAFVSQLVVNLLIRPLHPGESHPLQDGVDDVIGERLAQELADLPHRPTRILVTKTR